MFPYKKAKSKERPFPCFHQYLLIFIDITLTKLSARPVNIAPHLSSDRHIDSVLLKLILESGDHCRIGLHIIAILDRINRDQIHVTVHSVDELRKFSCILIRVIHTADQTVLERHSAPRLIKIKFTCIDHVMNVIFVGNRHQFQSLLLVRGMEGQSKRDRKLFIRKLPHQLVEAFKATLEELEYADLLLHVIDISDPHWLEQAQIVDELIEELGAQQIPCLRVYNKSDLYFGDIRPHGEDSVNISAKTGEGVDELLARIDKLLDKGTRRVTIHLPYDKGGLLDMLYREAKVESVEYGETIDIVATCVPRVIGQVKD